MENTTDSKNYKYSYTADIKQALVFLVLCRAVKRRKMYQCSTIKYIHTFKNKTQPIKATFLKQAVQNSDVETRVVWKNIT